MPKTDNCTPEPCNGPSTYRVTNESEKSTYRVTNESEKSTYRVTDWERERNAAAEAYLHKLWQRPGNMELMDEQFMIFKAGADWARDEWHELGPLKREIERLTAELADAEMRAKSAYMGVQKLRTENDLLAHAAAAEAGFANELRAEVERLRAALESIAANSCREALK